MKALKERILWILPLTLFIALYSLLFFQGAEAVSNRPSDDWSRGIEIGKTDSKTLPTLHHSDDGKYTISLFHEGTLTKKVFSSNFSLEEESSTEVPFTKWDPYYVKNDQIIYFKDEEIHIHNGELIAKAEEMFVEDHRIFYLQDSTFFSLNPKSLESTQIGSVPEGYESYKVLFQDDTPTIVGFGTTGNKLNYGIYQEKDGELEELQAQTINITSNESIVEVAFTASKDKFGLAFKSLVENPGKDPYRLYVSEFQASSKSISYKNINPLDPKTGKRINEIGELSATYFNDQLNLSFYGVGYSKVDYKTNYVSNIYEINLIDQEDITAKRRSNTFKFSSKSKLINEDTIMWLDKEVPKTVYISSSQPEFVEQGDGYKSIDMLLALGITMDMVTKAIPFLVITMKWLIWPLAFFVLLFLFYKKSIDNNYNWVMYSAIGVYLLGALVQKDLIFTPTLKATGPFYVTFPGSSFVVIFLAALIAYGCMQFIHHSTGAGYKVAYFVFIHLLVLSLTAGPYVW